MIDEKSVRALKKRFKISDFLARRLLELYGGSVEASAARLVTEDLGALERRERELAKGYREKPEVFRACGRRDGEAAAREEIEKGAFGWMVAGKGDLCLRCMKIVRSAFHGWFCWGMRVPLKSASQLTDAETEGFREGYNAAVEKHVREQINRGFTRDGIRF